MEGPWLNNCVDYIPCETLSLPVTTPGSDNSSLLVPCSSSRSYRAKQNVLAGCSDFIQVSLGGLDGNDLRKVDGVLCTANGDCLSGRCVLVEGNRVCVDACGDAGCSDPLVCANGNCVPPCLQP
jgi:hypothetical protein